MEGNREAAPIRGPSGVLTGQLQLHRLLPLPLDGQLGTDRHLQHDRARGAM